MKNCVPTLFQASPSFSLHHKLCQSPKTLTKSINMIINHFQSMLCRGVLQTPYQHPHQHPQKHSHKNTLLVSFFYPPLRASPRFSELLRASPSFFQASPRFSELLRDSPPHHNITFFNLNFVQILISHTQLCNFVKFVGDLKYFTDFQIINYNKLTIK